MNPQPSSNFKPHQGNSTPSRADRHELARLIEFRQGQLYGAPPVDGRLSQAEAARRRELGKALVEDLFAKLLRLGVTLKHRSGTSAIVLHLERMVYHHADAN